MACIAASLLDHTSSSGGRARTPPNRELVLIEDSAVQSACALFREIVRRAQIRAHTVALVAALRDPAVYGATDAIDVHQTAVPFSSVSAEELEARIGERAGAGAKSVRVTVLVDSLSALRSCTGASDSELYTSLVRISRSLPRA